jgi:hypothetical protein
MGQVDFSNKKKLHKNSFNQGSLLLLLCITVETVMEFNASCEVLDRGGQKVKTSV